MKGSKDIKEVSRKMINNRDMEEERKERGNKGCILLIYREGQNSFII